MKFSRLLKHLLTAFALALFALAAQSISIQASQPLAPAEQDCATCLRAAAPPYITYLPQISKQVITGRLTSSGVAVAGQRVAIEFSTDGGSTFHDFAETVSDASGNFTLPVPSLQNNQQVYDVYWRNTAENEAWLGSFYGNTATILHAQNHYNMDIANIYLVSPNPGASVNLPVTFIWQRRTTLTDDYGVGLTNGDQNKFKTVSGLGYADRATMTTVPDWVVVNAKNYWYGVVQTPDGIGFSYWMYEIYFRNLSSLTLNSPEMNTWQPVETMSLHRDLPRIKPAE